MKRRVDHRCVLDALVEGALRPPLGPLLVLLDEGDVASVLDLEELGVLVGVEDLALLGPVDLLLEHPVVAVGDGLLQDGVLLGVVADRRPPELLDQSFIVHLLDDARVLDCLYLVALLQLLQEVAVAQVVSLVEEEVEGARLHYIQAHVLDRFLLLVGLPGVELVEDRDGSDPHEGARVRLGDVDLGEAASVYDRRFVPLARAHSLELVQPSDVRRRPALVQDLDVLRIVVAPVVGLEELIVELGLGVLQSVEDARVLHLQHSVDRPVYQLLALDDEGAVVHR